MRAIVKPDAFNCGRYRLSLAHPLIMGVVNITPDSFSDGGDYFEADRACARARELVAEGADILDIGGESSRPGAQPVSLDEERRRVLPVLEEAVRLGVPVSVDTTKPELMREAIALGASVINDISALGAAGAADVIVDNNVGVCLMHMLGTPASMQVAPAYQDVVSDVSMFLVQRARSLLDRGVDAARIVLDPGFGFGKTDEHNTALLRALPAIAARGFPVMVGLSRKSQLGRIIGNQDAKARLGASIAAALAAVSKGAAILRVHDVAATRDALLVWRELGQSDATDGVATS
jgi:dihydropteroate synthase